jgi:hypothetical protein
MNKDLRNKLGNYEPPYNPEHWQQLSDRLAVANQRRNYLPYAAAILLLLGVMAALVCYVYSSQPEKDVIAITQIDSNMVAKSATDNSQNVASQTNNDKKLQEKVSNQLQIATQNNTNANQSDSNTKNVVIADINHSQKNTLKTTETGKKEAKNDVKTVINSTKATDLPTQLSNVIAPNTQNSSPATVEILPQKLIFSTIQRKEYAEFPKNDTLKPKFRYFDLKEVQQITQRKKKMWRFGVLAMPMLAVWNKKQRQEFDVEKGLVLEYKFNKIAIGTGVWLSHYEINTPREQSLNLRVDSSYTVNTYLSANQQTTALLLPISLRYNLLENEKNSFFITANLLNTFLLSEKQQQKTITEYNFDFINSTFTPNKRSSFENQQHIQNDLQLFSALQFQLGYERKLNKNLSCQIEPFVRVGLHKEQSYATGVALRMNYNFVN